MGKIHLLKLELPRKIENSRMTPWKDLGRVFDGLSLIAKEFVKRSPPLESARTGDLETLVKKALVSATDLSGLTRGKVRQFSNPRSSNSKLANDSVVYFTDLSDASTTNSDNAGNFRAEDKVVVADNGTRSQVKSSLEASDASVDADVCSTSKIVDEGRHCSPGKESEAQSLGERANADEGARGEVAIAPPQRRRTPRERKVPSTSFSRALGFAGLGAGLAWGTLQESAKRLVYGRPSSQDHQSALSPFLSEKNAERLALALCRMRGAALKIGQMLSIQDESLVPAPILTALEIVRQGADVMPKSQLDQVLNAELGPDWTSKLISFDYEPMAAASIGQVHRAVTKNGMHVAMKIQYPGVADSIESDIENVKLLLDYTNLIPEGLYLDRAMKVAREELSRECDYELEAANQRRFRDMIAGREGFYVPLVVDDISRKRVLTTELVSGITIDKVASLDQETRNYVGKKLLELTLLELFVFRFMQTDPNWGNFLYNEATNSINLIDFGASRDYPKRFVDDYLKMVLACANRDSDGVVEMSRRLGFITGMESEVMLDAHVQAGFVVGTPFAELGGYDFRANNITHSVSHLGGTMLKHRLTPPPDEAYSLHRKLSGAFLACIKMGAVVPCRELLLEVYEHHQFRDEGSEISSCVSMSS